MRVRQVTRKDVRAAALIGQIIAEAELADVGTICIVDEDDCCGHDLEEHCVAKAVGASEQAVWLWLNTSNAIATPLDERASEIADAATSTKRRAIEKLYAWVDAMTGVIVDLGTAELHAAAVLRGGDLPPGWKVVSTARRSR